MREIYTTYDVVTPESTEDGDFAEHGWYDSGWKFDADDKPESGFTCEPDEFDLEDNLTAVDLAVKFLKDNGVIESSSSSFHNGVWYLTERSIEDYGTGESVQYSFHLEGFTESEQAEIYSRLFPKVSWSTFR